MEISTIPCSNTSACAILFLLESLLVFFVLIITCGVPHNRRGRHGDIVKLIHEFLIKLLSRKNRPEAKVELSNNIQEVLVEVVQYEIRVPSVSFSTMEEQKWLQELELADSIISTSSSLLTFFTKDSNANVGCEDHSNIICAISNSEGSFTGMTSSNQANNICFLFRRHSASQYDIDLIRDF